MKIAHIYADEHDGSYFAHGDAPLSSITLFEQLPPFPAARLVGADPVKLFAVSTVLSVLRLHTAPERQLAVSLNGRVPVPDGRQLIPSREG